MWGPAPDASGKRAQVPSLGVGTEADDGENRRSFEDYPPADDLWPAGIFGVVRFTGDHCGVVFSARLTPAQEIWGAGTPVSARFGVRKQR